MSQSLCHIPGRISARRLVRAIARRRSALVAESRGRFGNAASVRARRRAPGRGYDTGSHRTVCWAASRTGAFCAP
ncbi:hypothetical protein FNH04_16760 [Streptomyces phyllanthi]|uniref:Uncharacterized protein n=1 Tax=Streptomyces phyllanthi TaxID=1803180 RepID=A0A5N8W1W3_9ACTN|nr:hypothetical protein [Streptomyces phyllanthi]